MDQVLIAVDGSPEAWYAADIGLDLAATHGATVTFLHASSEAAERVAARDPLLPDMTEDLSAAEPLLEEALARAPNAGVEAKLELARAETSASVVAEILALAEEVDADVIVAGSRGRGAGVSSVLGSVSHELLRAAPAATIIVKVPDVR